MIPRKTITEKELTDEIKRPILFFCRHVGVSSLWMENSQQSFLPCCHLLTLVPPFSKPHSKQEKLRTMLSFPLDIGGKRQNKHWAIYSLEKKLLDFNLKKQEREKEKEREREEERERRKREPYPLFVLSGATVQPILVTSPSECGFGPFGLMWRLENASLHTGRGSVWCYC